MEPQVRFCTTPDGVRIAYCTYGEAQARPLVLIHRWPSAFERWFELPAGRALLDDLAPGRQIISYDRRGIGASQRDIDDVSEHAQLADFTALVDHLRLNRFDLLAYVPDTAVRFAAQYPERVARLVLVSPHIRGTGIGRGRGIDNLVAVIRVDWSLARRAMATSIYPSGPAELQRWWSEMLRDAVPAETAAKYLESAAAMDISELTPRVQAPALIIHLRGERATPASASREVAALIPDARFVPVDGDWAWFWLPEQRGEVVRLIREFLEEESDQILAAELASGTAVILFADIVDSTALTERLGDAAFRDKARDLDAVLRAIIRDNAGTPIEGKLLGDGVLATFTSARQAIEAALACGRAGDDGGLPLHLGLHAGDVIREDDPDGRSNVYGGAVNIAARISGLSAPGEVLVSDTVRSLARTSAGVTFEDRGEQSLKGVGEPVRVWAVREG